MITVSTEAKNPADDTEIEVGITVGNGTCHLFIGDDKFCIRSARETSGAVLAAYYASSENSLRRTIAAHFGPDAVDSILAKIRRCLAVL